MKTKISLYIFGLTLALFALTACATPNPTPDANFIICPADPAANPVPCTKDNPQHIAPVGYVRVEAALVPEGTLGIARSNTSEAEVTIVTPAEDRIWNKNRVSIIPITKQELITDSNTESDFCKKRFPLCLGNIKGQFEYSDNAGKTQMAAYEVQIIIEFTPVVNKNTIGIWNRLDRTKTSGTWETFVQSFHNVPRGDKLVNLGNFNPVPDLGGTKTREKLIAVYMQRIEAWELKDLVTDVKITIKSLTLPGVTDITTNTTSGQGSSITNDALADAQRQQKILDADAYRKQAEAICGKDMVMAQTCVDHMRTYLGIIPPLNYPIQPTTAPTAVPTKKP